MDLLELDRGAILKVDGDRARRRTQRPDLDAIVYGMGAQHPVRVGVLAADERVELGGRDGTHRLSATPVMPSPTAS